MQTITLKVKTPEDYYLLREIAERLGIDIIDLEQGNEKNQQEKNWEFVGSIDIKGRMDNMNIRDIAHE